MSSGKSCYGDPLADIGKTADAFTILFGLIVGFYVMMKIFAIQEGGKLDI